MCCLGSDLSSINFSEIGENPKRASPSQPAKAGGVETVVVNRSELKGILVGMVLGDSTIALPKEGINAYMRIQHGLRAADYLRHKAEILRQLTDVTVGDVGGKYPGIYARTKNHPLYTRLRKLAYPEGKKVVTKTWLNWLTPQGLAIWYMDDGSLNKSYSINKSGRRRIFSRQLFLHTCSFSLEENELLVSFIEKTFDIKFRIKKNGKYLRLNIGAVEANRFLEIVKPYIVPCMEYKTDMEYDLKQPDEKHLLISK